MGSKMKCSFGVHHLRSVCRNLTKTNVFLHLGWCQHKLGFTDKKKIYPIRIPQKNVDAESNRKLIMRQCYKVNNSYECQWNVAKQKKQKRKECKAKNDSQ